MPKGRTKNLGTFVEKRRDELGLSLREVARRTGVEASTLMRIERGEIASPGPGKLQKLARALDVAVEDLYALVGYADQEALPEFAPYLRAKYDLPDAAVEDLDRHFARLKARYGEKGGPRGKRAL